MSKSTYRFEFTILAPDSDQPDGLSRTLTRHDIRAMNEFEAYGRLRNWAKRKGCTLLCPHIIDSNNPKWLERNCPNFEMRENNGEV